MPWYCLCKLVARLHDHAWRPVDPQTAFFDGSYEKDDPPMLYAYPPAIMPQVGGNQIHELDRMSSIYTAM